MSDAKPIAYTNVTADDWVLRDDAAPATGDAGGRGADGVEPRDVAPLNPTALSYATLEKCPVCGSSNVVKMQPGWGDLVVAKGADVPLVGCGNPWHYVGLDR